MNDIILSVKNIFFKNENYLVLDDISIDIEKDTFNCIIGKSGAGKSTLLKIMAGLLIPTSGSVIAYNKDLTKLFDRDITKIRKLYGFAFQDSALISNLSIKENLSLPLKNKFKYITLKDIDDKIFYYMDRLNMSDSLTLRPAQLSYGEQKLLSVVRSIIADPEILFLDEPLTSIDATLMKKILNIITEYTNKENTTIIAVTHSKDLLLNISSRVMLLEDKKIKLDCKGLDWDSVDKKNLPEILQDILG
ncbi:MAG TPA: ATP-binding cassette domain-containing protein [Spirochaetota bacterium]|jgi:ABC-type lipoprotein export system ATPase subunit|nr:MAG: putative ABC transporter ATP-binding protein [Spirochaetes bacterium ADurb.Bin133]HNZ27575.1 ATP-binding cassette domain-containing protein [Spirochaetota bacterium]HPY87346.1 ATP-binding cassette domain-containing protein [Spirochaetota bacterium]HQB62126.1 ATP-binding cassette domain-containing protein [Spirochaetota bacterium]